MSNTHSYLEQFDRELAWFRYDCTILTGEKIEQRCEKLSHLLTAAFESGEFEPSRNHQWQRAWSLNATVVVQLGCPWATAIGQAKCCLEIALV